MKHVIRPSLLYVKRPMDDLCFEIALNSKLASIFLLLLLLYNVHCTEINFKLNIVCEFSEIILNYCLC